MIEQAKRVNFLVIHILTLETRAGKTYTHKKTQKRDQKNQTKLWNAFSYLKNGGENIYSESITEPTEQCSVKEFNWMSVGSQSVSCLSICWKKNRDIQTEILRDLTALLCYINNDQAPAVVWTKYD